MADDIYARNVLSDLSESSNIYPVGSRRVPPIRSSNNATINRNIPSSPIDNYNFDDYEDDETLNEGPKYSESEYDYSEPEYDDYTEQSYRSPVRRISSGDSQAFPQVVDRTEIETGTLDNLTNENPTSSRITKTPSHRNVSKQGPILDKIPSNTPLLDQMVSKSSIRTSEASRNSTSPRSILFPPDIKYSKNVVNNNASDVLISNGYTPVKTIVVDNSSGKSDYILAVNKRGQYILISLGSKINNLGGTIIHTEVVKNNNSIPYSSKRGAFECSNGVCGVAYDGDSELSIVTRDEYSLEPRSDTLVYKGQNVASIGNNIPIPVINYSDIVHDPISVLKISYEISDRLHRYEYENCKESMAEAATEFKELENALKSYMLLEIKNARDLAFSISQLRQFAAQYERDPPVNERERENYDLIKFNLRKRSDLFITLIKCCEKIGAAKNTFSELTKEIHELHELCQREFSGVSDLMTP